MRDARNHQHGILRLLAGSMMCLVIVIAAGSASADIAVCETDSLRDSAAFRNAIDTLAADGVGIQEVTMTPSGEWVILSDRPASYSAGFPNGAAQVVNALQNFNFGPEVVAFVPGGGWAVATFGHLWTGGIVPDVERLRTSIEQFAAVGQRLLDLSFTPDGNGWVLVGEGAIIHSGAPEEVVRAADDLNASRRARDLMQFGGNGSWLLCGEQWCASEGISPNFRFNLSTLRRIGWTIDHVAMDMNGNYVIYSEGDVAAKANVASEVENTIKLGNGTTTNLYTRIEDLKVPGVSIAYIEDNQVTYARSYGVLDADTQRFVTADSPFDAASLSKMIGAMGVMRVVEENLGLDLNTDLLGYINDNQRWDNPLYVWKAFRENQFWAQSLGLNPVVGDSFLLGVNLKRLLSHTASLTPTNTASTALPHNEYPPNAHTGGWLLGYEGTVKEYGGNQLVWFDDSLRTNGLSYNYTGGGFLIADALMEDVTGQSFDAHSQQRVLMPLGMTNSTFHQPISVSVQRRAAVHHDDNGNPRTEKMAYPWRSAGGLYTTPRDYAKAMVVLNTQGMTQFNTPFLDPANAKAIVTNQLPNGVTTNPCASDGNDNDNDTAIDEAGEVGPNCDNLYYGLGTNLNSSTDAYVFNGLYSHYGKHNHGAYNYMEGRPGRDSGIVIMMNTASDNAAKLMNEIVAAYRCSIAVGPC